MSSVAEILDRASGLDFGERLELVTSLLEGLDPKPHHISDEEARRRLEDLRSGVVEPLGEAEFWRACGR